MIKVDNEKVREIFKDRWRNRRVENAIEDFDELIDKVGLKKIAVGYLRSKGNDDLALRLLRDKNTDLSHSIKDTYESMIEPPHELHCLSENEKEMLESSKKWIDSFTDDEFLELYNKVASDASLNKEPKEEYLVLNGSELVKEGLTYDEALQVALKGVDFSSDCEWDYHYQIVKVIDEWVPSWWDKV